MGNNPDDKKKKKNWICCENVSAEWLQKCFHKADNELLHLHQAKQKLQWA